MHARGAVQFGPLSESLPAENCSLVPRNAFIASKEKSGSVPLSFDSFYALFLNICGVHTKYTGYYLFMA